MKRFQKSTRQLVQGKGTAPKHPEEIENPKKQKKERTPKDANRATFFRTRTFYGLLAILGGIGISLVGIPTLQMQMNKTVSVLVFDRDIRAGTQITDDMLATLELAAYHLPAGTQTEMERVVGQYVCVDAIAGDFVTNPRLSVDYPGDDPELLQIPPEKLALSISLSELAQNVSGKLRPGDVIRIFAVNNDVQESLALAPEALSYVEIIAVSYADGVDITETGREESNSNHQVLSAVTLLVNERQAALLTGLGRDAALYAALAVRGDDAQKENVLAQQEEYFAALEKAEAESDEANISAEGELPGEAGQRTDDGEVE